MGNEKMVQEAVINLYRSATGDNVSTPDDIVEKFANSHIEGPLEYYSQIGGRVHPNGHIPIGMFPKKSVEDILKEGGLIT